MRTYIIRRLLLMIPTLFLVSLIIFLMIRLVPGNIIDLMLAQYQQSRDMDRASIEHAIEHMDSILELGDAEADELRTTLWMTGFRATVNVHGDVVHLEIPGWEDGEHG